MQVEMGPNLLQSGDPHWERPMGCRYGSLQQRGEMIKLNKLTQDYTNKGDAVVIVTVIMTIMTTLIVALRIAARFFVLRLRGADDWLIMGATAVTIANVICIVIGEDGLRFNLEPG